MEKEGINFNVGFFKAIKDHQVLESGLCTTSHETSPRFSWSPVVCGLPKTSSRKTSGLNWKALKVESPPLTLGWFLWLITHPVWSDLSEHGGSQTRGRDPHRGHSTYKWGHKADRNSIVCASPRGCEPARIGAQHGKWGCNQTPRG